MRLQLSKKNGVRWLNDAYNANADSVKAALETLASLEVKGKRYAGQGRSGGRCERSGIDVARLAAIGRCGFAEGFARSAIGAD